MVLSGTCDGRILPRLLDEGRGLALAGASDIDISLAGVTDLHSGGAAALAEFSDRLSHLGIKVRIGGVLGAREEALLAAYAGGSWTGPIV